MTLVEYLIIFAGCLATMLACRVIPLFALKGHALSTTTQQALELIPPAAFAALVTNDLFKPDLFATGLWDGIMPLIAAAVVVAVAVKTKNLIGCAIVGVVMYVILMSLGF